MLGFGAPTPPAGGGSVSGGPAVDAVARAAAAAAQSIASAAASAAAAPVDAEARAAAAAAQTAADTAQDAADAAAAAAAAPIDSTARAAASAAQTAAAAAAAAAAAPVDSTARASAAAAQADATAALTDSAVDLIARDAAAAAVVAAAAVTPLLVAHAVIARDASQAFPQNNYVCMLWDTTLASRGGLAFSKSQGGTYGFSTTLPTTPTGATYITVPNGVDSVEINISQYSNSFVGFFQFIVYLNDALVVDAYESASTTANNLRAFFNLEVTAGDTIKLLGRNNQSGGHTLIAGNVAATPFITIKGYASV